jgi:hypothetical protein
MYGEGGRWLQGQRLGPAAQGGLPGLSKKPSTVLAGAALAAMRESRCSGAGLRGEASTVFPGHGVSLMARKVGAMRVDSSPVRTGSE